MLAQMIEINYDEAEDVLYVKDTSCTSTNSEVSAYDDYLIFNYRGDRVVGLQILCMNDLLHSSASFWFKHPSRVEIPEYILSVVDKWVNKHKLEESNDIFNRIAKVSNGIKDLPPKEELALQAAKLIYNDLIHNTVDLSFLDKDTVLERWKNIIINQNI